MFATQQKAGAVPGTVLSAVFGCLLVIVSTVELFIIEEAPSSRKLPLTLRVPGIGLYRDTQAAPNTFVYQRIRIPRGSTPEQDEHRLIQAYMEQRQGNLPALLLGLGLSFFLAFMIYTTFLRRESKRCALFRTQLVLLLGILTMAVAGKVYLILSPWSAMWIPLAVFVIPVAALLGQRAAAATSTIGALTLGLVSSVDISLLLALLGQGLTAGILVNGRGRRGVPLLGAAGAVIGGGVTHVAVSLLLRIPLVPTDLSLLDTDLVAVLGGGLLSGLLSIVTTPLLGVALGTLTRPKLYSLANLEAPPLKALSSRAPGTWAHSLAVANMAEMAANAIGADALLVRVGAYYHDLGKAVQPEYFIENLHGKASPHDTLDPDLSADAIFAHVTEGVREARKHKVPEPVVEFIYSHHANSLVEYFWHKNEASGNVKNLTEDDFRYPGTSPQSPEAAIISICDAVEAASRTLEDSDPEKISTLVRQIVFTKIEQGVMDESGLTLADLRRVVESVVETLKSSRHGRVKYPWQEREDASPSTSDDSADSDAPHTADGEDRVDEEKEDEERGRVLTKPLGTPVERE